MKAPLLDRIVDLLEKINLEECIELRRELQVQRHLNPHAESITQLKLLVLKSAYKNTAEAVKACEHLGLAEEALEFASVLSAEVKAVSDEVNQA